MTFIRNDSREYWNIFVARAGLTIHKQTYYLHINGRLIRRMHFSYTYRGFEIDVNLHIRAFIELSQIKLHMRVVKGLA